MIQSLHWRMLLVPLLWALVLGLPFVVWKARQRALTGRRGHVARNKTWRRTFMGQAKDMVVDGVFWLLSPVWVVLILIFAAIAWALGYVPRRDGQ
jgi:hypothetical protein